MARPIPLTADPDNPASPAGAIPVDLFGVEGGGGGDPQTAQAELDFTWQVTGGYANLYRSGQVVWLSYGFTADQARSAGSGLTATVPAGFTPGPGSNGLVKGYAAWYASEGTGFSEPALASITRYGLEVEKDLAEDDQVKGDLIWLTDDPFPESD